MGRVFTTPPITIAATLSGGSLVSLFPGVPYKRRLRSLVVKCSVTGTVNVYAGIMSDTALIESNGYGSNNTLNPISPSVIQPGYPMYVQWPSAVSASNTAQATAVFEGEI